jgi:phage terminase small subunit
VDQWEVDESAAGGKLSPRQEAFCLEYLKDLNGTQAAIRAGYTDNPDAAAVQASRMLINAKVVARVQELMDARAKRTEISADRVVQELATIGFAKLDAQALIDEARKLMENAIDPRALTRMGYSDKLKALELLGKHLKLFTEKHEHSGPDGAPIEVSASTPEQRAARLARIQELSAKLALSKAEPEQS